ncbi:hypothetical protein [Streptosporangium sp. NPDC049078]|uniref:hypothetical protein n=1 Tax=Streptosporangium sp. NPDC049078 TaxID=3155767 RepID=UPI003421AC88
MTSAPGLAAFVLLRPGDPGEPGWVEAASIGEVEELARAGRTVVVTPARLAGVTSAPPVPSGDLGESDEAEGGADTAGNVGRADARAATAAAGNTGGGPDAAAASEKGAENSRTGTNATGTPATWMDTAGDAARERDAEAAELTAASICAWAGARVFRTDRVEQVRLAVEMTDALAGRRPPALTRRGLA